MTNALLVLSQESLQATYGERIQKRIRGKVDSLRIISPSEGWREQSESLNQVDVIFSGWGAPLMDEEFLKCVPNLKAVFYAGGSVRGFVTDAFWQRGIRLSTARAINSIPVSEYTVAALTLGLKRVWHYHRLTCATRNFPSDRPMPGAYGSTVGLVSYGAIARLVRQRLRQLDVTILVYDPYLTAEEAQRQGVTKVSLERLFEESDAVSVHTPNLPETTGLIKGRHLSAMKPGAFFLNTARGEVVDEPEMISVLQHRQDLQAMLDVSYPEPPPTHSPLYDLPNVVITPHLAGSVGAECERMGQAMVDEFERFQTEQPLQWETSAADAPLLA